MYKKLCLAGFMFVFLTAIVFAGSKFDFKHMSNDELFQLRGTIEKATAGDKEAYQLEWETRLANMTDEEKRKYGEPSEGRGTDNRTPRILWTPGSGYEQEGGPGQINYGGQSSGQSNTGR